MSTHNGATLASDAIAASSAGRELARKELLAECRRLAADAEALMHRASNLSGEAFSLARGELDDKIVVLRERYEDLAGEATRRGKAARDVTDAYVRENPWRSVAAAAAVGALFGALMLRRGD